VLLLRPREAHGVPRLVFEVVEGEAFRSVAVVPPPELIRMEIW
jgi:hypothetical protein